MNDPEHYRYGTVRGSCANPAGAFLELWDNYSGELALWAFYLDEDGSMEFKEYQSDVTKQIKEWFKKEAYRLLPPIKS